MGTVGLVQGLPNHLWYTWLDRILPGRTLTTVGKKIVADQLICSPISSASFFVGAGMLEGCSVLEGWEEYKSKFLLVYLVSIRVRLFKDLSIKYLNCIAKTTPIVTDRLYRLAT